MEAQNSLEAIRKAQTAQERRPPRAITAHEEEGALIPSFPQSTPSDRTALVDVDGIVDTGSFGTGCDTTEAEDRCSGEKYAMSVCAATGRGVAPAYGSRGMKMASADFPRGIRTARQYLDQFRLLAQSGALQGEFTGVDIFPLGPSGDGTQWALGFATSQASLLSAGIQIILSRELLGVQSTKITICNAPTFAINGKLPLPGLNPVRKTLSTRGTTPGSLSFEMTAPTSSWFIPWAYLAASGMAIPVAEMVESPIIPDDPAYDYFASMGGGVPGARGLSIFVTSSTKLTSVRCLPLTNNNTSVPQIAQLVAGG